MSLTKIPTIEHWHKTSNPPPLSPGHLHLWRILTGPKGAPLGDLLPLLSHQESERADKLRAPHHRERYARAHAGLRAILSTYINIAPQQIVFTYGHAGKPALGGIECPLSFNMTTSGDLALVAISDTEPVGVDCERVRQRNGMVGIARRMFTPDAASRVSAAAPGDRLEQFHLGWTALEAAVKVDGRGLSRRNEPAIQDTLDIVHCVPERGFMAAVARKVLPPLREWVTLELAVR